MSRYLALALALALPSAARAQTVDPAPPPASPGPATQMPRVKNLAEVVRELEAAYPAEYREAGIGGDVYMRMRVDTAGVPGDFAIVRGSGRAQFDSAAMRVAGVLRFYPATANGKPVAQSATVPIHFVPEADITGERAATPAGTGSPAASPARVPLADDPVRFTINQTPEVLNPAAVRAATRRLYPPRLRLAGVGGRAIVTVNIDTVGAVTSVELTRGTGNSELDAAAVAIARTMRFRPAIMNQRRIRTILEVPITFDTGRPAR